MSWFFNGGGKVQTAHSESKTLGQLQVQIESVLGDRCIKF
jgi:hypothetical protein